jgi:hypothetical protein
VSRPQAAKCAEEFAAIISDPYGNEYLCSPSADDLKQVVKLHNEVNRIDGLFGSLDCMQKIVQMHDKVLSKLGGIPLDPMLYWRHCFTTFCGSNLHPLDMLGH